MKLSVFEQLVLKEIKRKYDNGFSFVKEHKQNKLFFIVNNEKVLIVPRNFHCLCNVFIGGKLAGDANLIKILNDYMNTPLTERE